MDWVQDWGRQPWARAGTRGCIPPALRTAARSPHQRLRPGGGTRRGRQGLLLRLLAASTQGSGLREGSIPRTRTHTTRAHSCCCQPALVRRAQCCSPPAPRPPRARSPRRAALQRSRRAALQARWRCAASIAVLYARGGARWALRRCKLVWPRPGGRQCGQWRPPQLQVSSTPPASVQQLDGLPGARGETHPGGGWRQPEPARGPSVATQQLQEPPRTH